MKIETFFEKFDLITDAPDAVAKMRRLILHLAIRGSLIAPNSDDTPATMSFPDLVRHGVAPDAAFPAHWLRVRLGDVGEWRGGEHLLKQSQNFGPAGSHGSAQKT